MQLDISRKIMEILDDNAQQVPEGFYLEVCNQLKKLHGAASGVPQDDLVRRELAMIRSKNRLERQATELNSLKDILNKSVKQYNKCVENFKERKRKLDQTEDRIQVRDDLLKGREKLMDDFEDNMTLAELQRTLILVE
jgi:exonuclease VII small subunit